MQQFKNLMLDIETFGNQAYSSILSIGAVEFDLISGDRGREFYVNIDLQSCLDLGLIINGSTLLWWMKQGEIAKAELMNPQKVLIIDALEMFKDFCNKDYYVWSRSPRFDCGILQNAYNKAKIDIPWDFRKERCVRTLESFAPEIKAKFDSKLNTHNPLDDCKYQISYCFEIFKAIQ